MGNVTLLGMPRPFLGCHAHFFQKKILLIFRVLPQKFIKTRFWAATTHHLFNLALYWLPSVPEILVPTTYHLFNLALYWLPSVPEIL